MAEIKKEELDNLIEIKGEARGAVFQTDVQYVLEKEGEEGFRRLEKRIKELGYKIDYRKAKATDWYPISLRLISLLVIKDTFGWPDKEIREMGKTAPKFSFIVKFLLKIFAFLEKFVQQVPKFWEEHYTVGELKVIKLNEKNKELVIRLEGANFHPLFCLYLEGYCERIFQFVVNQPACRETKCVFKGDPYHEYTFTWQ